MENNLRANRQGLRVGRRQKKWTLWDILSIAIIIANISYLGYDYHYWQESPFPVYIFLGLQPILLILAVRIPFSRVSVSLAQKSLVVIILMLGINTAFGYYMLQTLYKDYPDFLRKEYYIEGIILVLIPEAVAVLFFVIVFVVICLLVMEHRRIRQRYRLEEEGIEYVEDN